MNDIDRRVIQIYSDELANKTIFRDLLRELEKHENIITSYLKKKYKVLQEEGKSNYCLNEVLYKDIQSRGRAAFGILVQSLSKVHPHLAELLLPNERLPDKGYIYEQEPQESDHESEAHLTEYKGICTVSGNEHNKSKLICAVKKLCCPIKARLVTNEETLTQANFHLAIKVEGKFKEEDIKFIENLYQSQDYNPSNLKIIIINVIREEDIDNAVILKNPHLSARKFLDSNSSLNPSKPPAVFIVNIHIHRGDHSLSVIKIIEEVATHNPGYEIRDVFRVVMEKLVKWGCRLNTESRSFPKFYF